MSLWKAPKPPASELGRYRILSPYAGIRVSPLQLGAMSIGDKWGSVMGSMDKDSSFKLLDAYYKAGGNFIDTSNNYQHESSEEFVGEWMDTRGVRDQIVLATKYTTNYKAGKDEEVPLQVNYVGNGTKSLHLSVEASLKKLGTSYIDILYVHWWDYETSVEEVMNSLHHLVAQGKVLYLGVSDTPAWVVAQANQYARDHGKTPFVVYQGRWNVMDRAFERDIIPMAKAHGMALAPWGVLAGGRLRSDAEEERRRASGENGRTMMGPDWERNEKEVKMAHALEKVAKEVGTEDITAVAIAYVMHKAPYVFPIIGGRKVEQLEANIGALSLTLTPEHIKQLEDVHEFEPGFPHSMIGDGTKHNFFLSSAGNLAEAPKLQPIRAVSKAAL